MLVLTPATMALLRARRGRTRDAVRGRLSRDRAEGIVSHLCALTRHSLEAGRIVTPLNAEALYRHTIRSKLCLQGWRWRDADRTALALVGVVLAILQAKRPDWNEGQPEFVIRQGTLIERTRCANCAKRLPDERPKFCSEGCRAVYHLRLGALREASEEQMATLASRSPL